MWQSGNASPPLPPFVLFKGMNFSSAKKYGRLSNFIERILLSSMLNRFSCFSFEPKLSPLQQSYSQFHYCCYIIQPVNVSPILRYISNFFSRDIIFIKATETVTFFPSFFFIRGNFIIYQTKIIHTDNNINPILFSLNNCRYIYIHHLYTNFQKFLHKSISINV